MNTSAMLLCDFYKLSHREQYPAGTEVIYSTWTPRSNKYHPTTDKVVVFGMQAVIKKYLIEYFKDNFFSEDVSDVLNEYTRIVKNTLGVENPETQHIHDLHTLGYLPIEIRALPEGAQVPLRVPMMTIRNTDKRFFWLTNYLETLLSNELWLASTAATIAKEYHTILTQYAEETGDPGFVQFQGHDFSMRGMSSIESAKISGSGHLLSFVGTDTIPAICHLEDYYNADVTKELVGTSIPATEHSVMCAGGDGENEFKTYERLITEVYPKGFVSIVSDTWDLWSCIENIIKPLKDKIMVREGRVVIRPDSGDPVKILCGDPDHLDPRINKGLIELLWDIFGGSVNEKGYKVLDGHIGAIYGDAITIERCKQICQLLKEKGFATTNVVYGIGSYTYQHNTRDTFGFAIKSTMCVIDGFEKAIYKNPATDDGTKKSNIGVVSVVKTEEGLKCIDGLTLDQQQDNLMRPVFRNGELLIDDTLAGIRARLKGE